MTLKCGKNKNVTQEAIAKGVTNVCHLLVLTTFDVICDLLLNRHKATWNLFVLHSNETDYNFKIF